MHLDLDRTIVALSSGAAAGRRAIIRMSGNCTAQILAQLLTSATSNFLLTCMRVCSRQVVLALDSPIGEIPARVYYWPDQRSYTGQPSAELHLLGSMPIVEALLDRICQFGARPAERGEFTLRSFIAGKLDLAQAEAVLGIIDADDEKELRIALEQLGGNLTRPVKSLRDQLLQLVAHLEAGLDFAEEDISFISTDELMSKLTDIRSALTELSRQLSARSSTNRLPRCVVIGLPNSGKSSLFNALLGQRRSIVTEVAGTTRDVVCANISLPDQEVELFDTAGVEDMADNSPRSLAQDASQRWGAQADMFLLCIDGSKDRLESWDLEQLQNADAGQCGGGNTLDSQSFRRPSTIVVFTKCDLKAVDRTTIRFDGLHTSALTLEGIDSLKRAIVDCLSSSRTESGLAFVHQTAVRCCECVRRATESIDAALAIGELGQGEELVASELRLALDELSAILGEVNTEDILGEIFSRFCIGK